MCIQVTQICVHRQVSITPTNLYFCPHLPLHPCLSKQKKHVIYFLFCISHFIPPCVMCCLQWALHQDMFTNTVAKVFPNSSDFNFGNDNAVDVHRHIEPIKKNWSSWPLQSDTFAISQEAWLNSHNRPGTWPGPLQSLVHSLFVRLSREGSPDLFVGANEYI